MHQKIFIKPLKVSLNQKEKEKLFEGTAEATVNFSVPLVCDHSAALPSIDEGPIDNALSSTVADPIKLEMIMTEF